MMRQGEESYARREPLSRVSREESLPTIDAPDSKIAAFSVDEREDVDQRCPDSDTKIHSLDDEERDRDDEQRSDFEACHRHEELYEERDSCEEREPTPSEQYDFQNQSEHDYQLQLLDEEEERMRQDLEVTNRLDQENRELQILDELQQIHDEEYPNHNTMEAPIPETEPTGNFVEIDEEEDYFELEGTPLSNDSQIQQLVATCDLRDKEDKTSISRCNGNLCGEESSTKAGTRKTTCVVCLEAPRTHAYVPCGHFCVCFSCAKEQTKQKRSMVAASTCPVCQQPSTRIMRIFIP